jgi:hypothetical protein
LNDEGDATKVVLEPGASPVSKPHFEIASRQATSSDNRLQIAQQSDSHTPSSENIKVSLVMPFVNVPSTLRANAGFVPA